MEGLAPPLELLITVKSALECGESVRAGINKFISGNRSDFSLQVSRWLFALDQSSDQSGQYQEVIRSIKSSYRQAVLSVLAQGLRGQSIMTVLVELEIEINDACRREMEQYVALLPIKLLIPLLLFQFPAYLVLLLGPLIKNFLGAF